MPVMMPAHHMNPRLRRAAFRVVMAMRISSGFGFKGGSEGTNSIGVQCHLCFERKKELRESMARKKQQNAPFNL
jgi:hypothetical protein